MTIRTRLTLWYAGLSLFSLSFLAWGLYREFVVEPKKLSAQGLNPDTPREEIGEVLLLYTLPGAILTVVGGWWLTRRLLAPVTRLTEAVEGVTLDNLSVRLPQAGTMDE